MFAPIICASALFLVACSSEPTRPAVCDTEYAGTVMACAKPKARTYNRRDYVEVCQIRGGHRECSPVHRSEIRGVLNDLFRY